MRTLRILASLLVVALLTAPGAVADEGESSQGSPLQWVFDFLDWVECVNNGGGIECDSPPRPYIL